jgi:hypothetical protein
MESHDEQTHFVKRVVLPSGKTIEVVYFREHGAADQAAGLPMAQPQAPEHPPAEPHHCPNCGVFRDGIFSQETVETFDEELDRGADALARDYTRLMRANMAEEIDTFVGALSSGAILPEDF